MGFSSSGLIKMDSCSCYCSNSTFSSSSSSSGFVKRLVKTAKFVSTRIRYSREEAKTYPSTSKLPQNEHEGLNNEDGVYRVFDVPEGRNDGVVTHHRLLMVTVVAIITSLALTSTKSALWQEAQQNQVGSDCEWDEPFVCHHKCQGLYTVTYRGGKAISIDCTPNYGTRERKCENKPKNLKVWSEALPEATCAWCIFLWLVTYPLLYMDRQYIQRLIYYMIVTSEAMAVCALLVRPVLIYMIPEFMACFVAILLLVLGVTFALVYVDHRNHLD